MPRKTDSKSAADWLWLAESDLGMVRLAADQETSYHGCRSKLAEVLEKVLKAELIRLGWSLEKTHDLNRLVDGLVRLRSPLLAQATPIAKALADVRDLLAAVKGMLPFSGAVGSGSPAA